MKLLYCELCGDIIAPWREPRNIRYCRCETHAVWWENPAKGILRICDTRVHSGCPSKPQAWVLGITNLFIQYPDSPMSASVTEAIIDAHEDYYLFKQRRSPIIRIRPGESGDTRWEKLPVD